MKRLVTIIMIFMMTVSSVYADNKSYAPEIVNEYETIEEVLLDEFVEEDGKVITKISNTYGPIEERVGLGYRRIKINCRLITEEEIMQYRLDYIAQNMGYEELPIIYIGNFGVEGSILSGFVYTYMDGTKAIYLNEKLDYFQMGKVFCHELTHYKYSNSWMFSKLGQAGIGFDEILTDEVACQTYESLFSSEYERTYKTPYPIDEILVKMYKGEISFQNEKYKTLINEIIETLLSGQQYQEYQQLIKQLYEVVLDDYQQQIEQFLKKNFPKREFS